MNLAETIETGFMLVFFEIVQQNLLFCLKQIDLLSLSLSLSYFIYLFLSTFQFFDCDCVKSFWTLKGKYNLWEAPKEMLDCYFCCLIHMICVCYASALAFVFFLIPLFSCACMPTSRCDDAMTMVLDQDWIFIIF